MENKKKLWAVVFNNSDEDQYIVQYYKATRDEMARKLSKIIKEDKKCLNDSDFSELEYGCYTTKSLLSNRNENRIEGCLYYSDFRMNYVAEAVHDVFEL